jgi:hypothetical protein
MTYTSTITGEEHASQESIVEELIETYVDLQREKFQIQSAETKLLETVTQLSEARHLQSNAMTKVQTLTGTTQIMKITPRDNVTYEKTSSGKPALESLYAEFPILQQMVRIDYKEKGVQIAKFLEGYLADDESLSTKDALLAERLLALRLTKAGKPAIKVETL